MQHAQGTLTSELLLFSDLLVSFDDTPSRKDEEILEEAIGPVVGHAENPPKRLSDSTSIGNVSSIVTLGANDKGSSLINSDKITTRSLRKKSNAESVSSSSADDSATKITVKKKGGGSDSSKKHRIPRPNGIAPAEVVLKTTSLVKEKEVATTGMVKGMISKSPKITNRERRSRRRQALSHDVSEQTPITTAVRTISPTVTIGSTSSVNKHPISQSSATKARGNDTSRNKKATKIGLSNSSQAGGKNEVLKVQLLTGTLYLHRGAKRHVEFIPKY